MFLFFFVSFSPPQSLPRFSMASRDATYTATSTDALSKRVSTLKRMRFD